MNLTETAQLLQFVAAFDQRTIGQGDVLAWHSILEGVTLPNARAAVVDYHRSLKATERRIVQADVLAGVKRVREIALSHREDPCPPAELVDDPAAYRAWQLEARNRIADEASQPTLREPQGPAISDNVQRELASPIPVARHVAAIREQLEARRRAQEAAQ